MEVLFGKIGHLFKKSDASLEQKRRKLYNNIKFDENPEFTWTLVGELGDGSFSKVYKAEHRPTGRMAAAKICELKSEEELQDLNVEIDILSTCRHPNIVELIESYYYDSKLWMLIEFCEGGAVDSIMNELEKPLTEPQIKYICHEICKGLEFLHKNRVIHRDLKAGNVLLTLGGDVKVADFGVSAKNKHTLQKRDSFIGTPYWMAPETIQCETVRDNPYDYKADIWSLGITLIEFAQRDPPHHDMSPVRVLLKIQKGEPPKLDFPSRWSREFSEFLSICLQKDPTKRPTAAALLEHPFISGATDVRPVRELILEFKADIEEVVEEEGSEKGSEKGSERGSERGQPSPAASSPVTSSGRKKYQAPQPPSTPQSAIANNNNNHHHSQQQSQQQPEQSLKSRRKTLTRTRKFVIDGVVMTTTTSKIIYAEEEFINDDQDLRKQELRELKMLQKQEARQFQDLLFKAQCTTEQLEKHLQQEIAQLLKDFDVEIETTNKQQKQLIEKLEQQQEETLKEASRDVRAMQQNELKHFREQLKMEFRCAKQDIEYLPKATRRAKKDKLALDQADAARAFIDQLNAAHDAALKQKTEQYQERLAAMERQFLMNKQQILRTREAALWELEEKHMLERQQLAKHQLKEIFFLQRHQMLVRHGKEMEQVKRINARHEENLLKRQSHEKRQLPKRIRSEMKTRELMFRESLRINTLTNKANGTDTSHEERDRLRQFQESEKNRYKAEQQRQEQKHQRQLEELRQSAINTIRELEQLQNEKRKALMEHETAKLKQMQAEHNNEQIKWRRSLKVRKARLEEEFTRQRNEQDRFYRLLP